MLSKELSSLKGLWRRKIVRIIVIYLILSSVFPFMPWVTPGGFAGSRTVVLASLTYILTGHGLVFWGGQLWWGAPPLV